MEWSSSTIYTVWMCELHLTHIFQDIDQIQYLKKLFPMALLLFILPLIYYAIYEHLKRVKINYTYPQKWEALNQCSVILHDNDSIYV